MKIAISCESTCDLSKELIKKYNISIIPYSIILGDKVIDDNENVPAEIFDYVEKNFPYKISHLESSIEARGLNEKVADILHQTPGEPSLYVSSTTFFENGRAFVYMRQYFHANHFRIKHRYYKKDDNKQQ